jgi:hypothetical protein
LIHVDNQVSSAEPMHARTFHGRLSFAQAAKARTSTRDFRRCEMNRWLKTALCLCAMLAATSQAEVCFAQIYQENQQNGPSSQNWANSQQNWHNSPDNWQNSQQNWQNGSQKWENNPQNWDNSANNYNNANGIYDSNGNRTGYVVPRADGGVNYFNDNGDRRAYQPSNQ